LGLFRHYRDLNKEPDCEMSMLENTIIADIKDAERVGSGKHLADFTSEELEAKVNELEMILNTDIVDTYKAMGEYKKAKELEDEIHMVKSMREQNSAQK
jgi:hypothetical protein